MSSATLDPLETSSPSGGSDASREGRATVLVKPRWNGPDGIRAILVLAVPLLLSQAVHGFNLFMDRVLLAWYSQEAFAAALQAGILSWTMTSVFWATVLYAGTFVAQYYGAKEEWRIGPVIWHAVYLAIIGGFVLAAIAPLGGPLFRWIGHEGNIPQLEAEYFFVLMVGAIGPLLNAAFYSFFSGQGRTMLVLFVNASACLLNICMNIWLIFKPFWIFPDGMGGAAWATVISQFIAALIFLAFIAAAGTAESRYRFWSGWRPDAALLRRMLKFGFPSGVHQTIDMIGFTTFMMVVGLFSFQAQHASNMAMNINLLLFIPAVGLHLAVSILSGQFAGARNYAAAERMTAGALCITMVYMAIVTVVYLFFPDPLLHQFRGGMPEQQWQEVYTVARVLLLFVAFYTTFDAVFLIYSGALKGAGDTRFVMWASILFSQMFLTGPSILLAVVWKKYFTADQALYLAWALCANYIIVLASVNLFRYRNGAWKRIDVIEHEPVV